MLHARRRVGHNALGVEVAAAEETDSSPRILTNAPTGGESAAALRRRVGHNALGWRRRQRESGTRPSAF